MPFGLRPIGNVTGIEIYRSDVVVKRKGYAPPVKDRTRAPIREFSKKSRQRLAFVANNTECEFKTMITLTYPRAFSKDGREVKRHINHVLIWLKRDVGKESILWFLEFQRRGAPHIHILSTMRWPSNRDTIRAFRFRLSSAWYRIVGSGDTRHLYAGTSSERIRKRDGARHYCVKYASKMRQKIVPKLYRNVGRFWGCTRDVPPKPLTEIRCTEDDIRGVMEGSKYAPREDRPVYRVLYNAAERFDACRLGEL